jgi:hypothetical protein
MRFHIATCIHSPICVSAKTRAVGEYVLFWGSDTQCNSPFKRVFLQRLRSRARRSHSTPFKKSVIYGYHSLTPMFSQHDAQPI